VIYRIKEQYNFGPKKMALYLKANHDVTVSPTAIYKYYKKRRLIRKPQKKLPWYTPMKEPFYASRPGENVQADVKYVPGEDRTWAYQFRFTDAYTNMQYAVDCLDKSSASAINAFRRAVQSFPFKITGIQTDNGGEFRGLFTLYLKTRGISHRFIPKRSAPWNGKVERANRSVDDEYYLNPERPWRSLADYTRWYNRERPHLGKNMNGFTPFQKFQEFMSLTVKTSPLKVY
jgi:transposase InsO family protein